jgi:hypothetical protein
VDIINTPITYFTNFASANNIDSQDGSAITQAVSRVLSQVKSCGICGGQSGAVVGFLRVFRFHLPILTPPTAPHSSIIWGWYNRPISGRGTKWTQSHPTSRKKKTTFVRGFFLQKRASLYTARGSWGEAGATYLHLPPPQSVHMRCVSCHTSCDVVIRYC